MQTSRVIVGMSGGVDSSVAAYLLQKEGHHVEGIFMKNWEEDDDDHCPAALDLADVRAVCDLLNIELNIVNFAEQYWSRVFAHFLKEYQCGRTPNPDIVCNKEIKFKAFLDYAKQRGADLIATGHYVRTAGKNTELRLLKGSDPLKDQSYFLYALNQTQLSQSLFPVGHLTKPQVRSLAKHLGLHNHAKKDSTGICFIGERKFKTFLNDFLPKNPGPIETIEGEEIGQHDGLMFYTLGQRQGLCIGGKKGRLQAPWFVARKDIKRNVLTVVQGEEHPALFKQSLIASQIHWINNEPPADITMTAKTRYRQQEQACVLRPLEKGSYQVNFETLQRAPTPGQSIVFYHEDICLGGGIIEESSHCDVMAQT